MANALPETSLDQVFRTARTYRGSAKAWVPNKSISDAQLQQIYDLAKFGPTSANCSPARMVCVKSVEAKEKLRQALDAGNVDQTMAAPVTIIVGSDYRFYEKMDKLYPHGNPRSWFEGKPEAIHNTAFRNSSLQGAYFIIAARALGFDCGPMSGFNNAMVDQLFFAGTEIKSNFLINIGYGNPDVLHPRDPRLDFAEACRIV